uniref:CASP-like protein 1 n=1 Tax=Erigeron canadensis TaxID=72917 RepID=UPI001CB8D18B|nr:CASP-like protein 1 [Erigeron canadensis]
MASSTAPLRAAVDMEIPVKSSAPPPSQYKASSGADGARNHGVVDTALRAVLFITSVAAVVVMLTSKQTKMVQISPGISIPWDANWKHSSIYKYFVVALSISTLYSIITGYLSFLAQKRGGYSTKLQLYLVILDTLQAASVSAAFGAGQALAYLGLKGSHQSGWKKICNKYWSFCHHVQISMILSGMASIALILLIWLSFYTLTKKIMTRR